MTAFIKLCAWVAVSGWLAWISDMRFSAWLFSVAICIAAGFVLSIDVGKK